MNVLRFLRTECVELNLNVVVRQPIEDESETQQRSRLAHDKQDALVAISELMDRSGVIVNRSKFLRDLDHRERKATTAIFPGIAIPHVRTLQARSFVMGLARAPDEGIPFASLDGAPTKLFFILTSPPYDDRIYLQVYRELAQLIDNEEVIEELLAATSVQDVFHTFRRVFA